jgi:hypothetical protein
MAVGRLTQAAYQTYMQQAYGGESPIPVLFYVGYPIRSFAANVSKQALKDKQHIFFTYAQYDPSVCASVQQCSVGTNYAWYLEREYQNTY